MTRKALITGGSGGIGQAIAQRLAADDIHVWVHYHSNPEAAAAIVERGVAPERVRLSLERNMHCAIGHCGHCQLGGRLLCRDGPVVRYDLVSSPMRVLPVTTTWLFSSTRSPRYRNTRSAQYGSRIRAQK